MKRRQDDLTAKEIAEMHKQTYLRAHPRAEEPAVEVEEEQQEEIVLIQELPEVPPTPEPEPDGEKEPDFSLDILEHKDKPPPDKPAPTDLQIKMDIVERIANPPDDRLIEMSEIPDAMVISIVLQIVQLAAADLRRTKPLGQVLIETYAQVMRARNRKLIIDLYKLFQTQTEKEETVLPGLDLRR